MVSYKCLDSFLAHLYKVTGRACVYPLGLVGAALAAALVLKLIITFPGNVTVCLK